jgi:hypothetical protein
LKEKFETECERFFKQAIKKHENLKFRFKLSLLKSDSKFQQEYLKKVQFLKLCDLNKIYTLFKNKQYDEANTYVKNSTEEIIFNAIRLTDDYDPRSDESSVAKSSASAAAAAAAAAASGYDIDEEDDDDDAVDDDDDTIIEDEYGGVTVNSDLVDDVRLKNKLIKLKSEKSGLNKTSDEEIIREIGFVETIRAWFWRLVPEEDFLLAVIIPITIVVALFVLTIVAACLLHMFNKGTLCFVYYFMFSSLK